MEYLVIRQHYGDRDYHAGDIRIVENAADAKFLTESGLIAKVEHDEKPVAKQAVKK